MVPRTRAQTPHRGGAEAQRKTPSGLDPQRLCASAVSDPQSARQAQENGMMASIMNIHALTLCRLAAFCVFCLPFCAAFAQAPPKSGPKHEVVLHAARLLDIESGKIITPGEVLVQGERIVEVGSAVSRPAGAEIIDLGDSTLLPGLIDAHVHLFLHPGAEDLQTVEESVPQRTILAVLAARADLMAGFTAERDMGTEGAGSADTAVRNAINQGSIPGPRLRISGNAVDILGGHEDANRFNPAQHVLSNATYANNAAELVTVIRQQFKEGADFIKIYETGRDSFATASLSTPYQYTEAELRAAVEEAARTGKRVAVHATGEPGTLYAARAGVVSIDHADQLSDETMRLMREKQIFAVPTFTISEYFADHAATPAAGRARAPDAGLARRRSFASSSRPACPWRSARTSARFPTARRRANSS